MGQYKGSLEVRGEWLEYLEKKIERNLWTITKTKEHTKTN
jgi:hypothetical protein